MTEKAVYCVDCGQPVRATARFCNSCGAQQRPEGSTAASEAAAPAPPVLPPTAAYTPASSPPRAEDLVTVTAPASASAIQDDTPEGVGDPGGANAGGAGPVRPAPEWQRSLPAPFNAIPLELLTVCGLMGFAGVLVLWPMLRTVPSLFELLGSSGFVLDLAVLLIILWLVLGFFGVSCIVLAWRLAHADRVARGLSFTLLGSLAAAIILGNVQDTQLTLVMLACCGAIAILWASPNVRVFFAGHGAPDGEQPVSVVVARTMVAVWASCALLEGLLFLPLGSLGSAYLPAGLLLVALSAGAFTMNRRLASGDDAARRIVSGGAMLNLIVLLVLGRSDPALLLPLALAAGIVWNLWLPEQSKQFFGAAPAKELA